MNDRRVFPFEEAEIRSAGTGERRRFVFRGYALPFGKLSRELREPRVNMGRPFVERIRSGAVDRTLREDDIRFLLNHDPRLLFARTGSGTLRLSPDSRGLETEAELPDTTYARDYAALVERGDAGEMSFRFAPGARDSWGMEAGRAVRDLHELKLREVSALTEPAAYADTSASVELEFARALHEADEELRAGRTLSAVNLAALREASAKIAEILERAEAGESSDEPRSIARLRLELRDRDHAA